MFVDCMVYVCLLYGICLLIVWYMFVYCMVYVYLFYAVHIIVLCMGFYSSTSV